jgi:hypothetical protein
MLTFNGKIRHMDNPGKGLCLIWSVLQKINGQREEEKVIEARIAQIMNDLIDDYNNLPTENMKTRVKKWMDNCVPQIVTKDEGFTSCRIQNE